jgi:protease IV
VFSFEEHKDDPSWKPFPAQNRVVFYSGCECLFLTPNYSKMNFLRNFLAALLALFVFSFLIFLLFMGVVAALSSDQKEAIKENSVLHLKLDGRIQELQEEDPLSGLPLPGREAERIGLLQLKQSIAHAKSDAKIKGIVIEAGSVQGGFATIEEIRESLLDFRKSGKWVVAYNEVFSEGAYYLASAADKIYIHPEGEVEFNGLTFEAAFFKRLLDKLEIKPQVFRVGEFKSAVEPFLLEQMSPESELQLSELANGMNQFMIGRISEARKIPVEKLKEISDNMLVRNARTAKEFGLVDELFYDDQYQDDLRQRIGLGVDDEINFVGFSKYRKTVPAQKYTQNEIAVIVADGTIVPGDGTEDDDVIPGETFVRAIRKARNNKKIKAIVLRINSPGGEFRASDMMWREITEARKQKPVIASMSDYAASGGYYMAMGCDTIVAQPTTITGSIGIFAMMPDMSGFFGNKIGITFDEVKTGNYGEMYTVTRPLTDAEKRFWQKNLEEGYDTFTGKAAQGRGIAKEEILKVAGGRVWTGGQAKGINLVDVEGGFDDAVAIAAAKAGVDDYHLRFYPKPKNFLEEWFSSQEEEATAKALKTELGDLYPYYLQFQKVKTYQGMQARFPFELTIH